MGDDDKPFACSQLGCGMRFVNEDHLSVHKQKHEMSLTLTTGTRLSNNLIIDFSGDQTPTPTKFLRNCEEIGLFSELTPSKNPFEDAFKKATQENMSHVSNEILVPSASVTVDVQHTLNTPIPPSINLPADSTQSEHFIPFPGPTTESGSTIISNQATPSPSRLLDPTSEMAMDLTMSSTTSSPSSSTAPAIHKFKGIKGELSSPITDMQSPMSESSKPLSVVTSVPGAIVKRPDSIMVTRTYPAVTTQQMILTSPTQEMVSLPSASPIMVTSPITSQQPSLAIATPLTATIRPQYLMQVMLQLPGGQTVPVQIPAALSAGSPVTSPANVHPQLVQPTQMLQQLQPQNQVKEPMLIQTQELGAISSSSVTTITRAASSLSATPAPSSSLVAEVSTTSSIQPQNNASAMTKQRLKAAITQNVQQSVLQNNMRVMSEAVERVIASPAQRPQTLLKSPPHHATTSLIIQPSPSSASSSASTSPNTVQMQAADTSTPYGSKRARKSSEDDPDERRRKFLERNRAAAARCRNKRKSWIANLERKADEINGVNSNLQGEISQLKSEVAQLKSLLLAHKDCPVFVQQRDSGQINLETVNMDGMDESSEGESVLGSAELYTVSVSSSSAGGAGDAHTSQVVPQTIISVISDESQYVVKQS